MIMIYYSHPFYLILYLRKLKKLNILDDEDILLNNKVNGKKGIISIKKSFY